MSRPLAVLLLLIATAIWGLAFVAQKAAMAHMGPLTFSGTRFLLGGVALLPFALIELRRRAPAAAQFTPRLWLQIGILCIAFLVGSVLQQYGLAQTSVTNSGFLTALYVLFAPLIAFLVLRTRPHPIIYLGAPLALIGIFYLNGGRLESFNAGDLLVVISAVFWGGHVFMLGLLSRATGLPVVLSAITFISVGLVCLVLAFGFETPDFADITAGWVQILYVGLMSTALAFTLQAIAQQYVPAANAAIVLSAESLFAALGGALLLGERLPPIGYAGAALILFAIILVEAVPALRQRRDAEAT
ncbi:MAG TPA: DMT family transporter [Devosia sp.]|jgi:drug/metabolite transporter (DMT)-like permease|uniref:DMT family transporter n=1 Tax=Devosia sp. TaxID=1871048 RepID=UPI002DDD81B8|nr:DMT family transporter [Devosia sp.]HEV2514603.1 DMT family transporter [Devosia sp.]